MPGYRALSPHVTGSAADSAREAEVLRRDGDPETAVRLLEEALDASRRVTPELPGWLCGRLAALYRTLGRYDDEVALLERYRESQSSEEARSRYDARLSKARTIAERKRRSSSGALDSVRTVLGKPRRRTPAKGVTASVEAGDAATNVDLVLSEDRIAELRAARRAGTGGLRRPAGRRVDALLHGGPGGRRVSRAPRGRTAACLSQRGPRTRERRRAGGAIQRGAGAAAGLLLRGSRALARSRRRRPAVALGDHHPPPCAQSAAACPSCSPCCRCVRARRRHSTRAPIRCSGA